MRFFVCPIPLPPLSLYIFQCFHFQTVTFCNQLDSVFPTVRNNRTRQYSNFKKKKPAATGSSCVAGNDPSTHVAKSLKEPFVSFPNSVHEGLLRKSFGKGFDRLSRSDKLARTQLIVHETCF